MTLLKVPGCIYKPLMKEDRSRKRCQQVFENLFDACDNKITATYLYPKCILF